MDAQADKVHKSELGFTMLMAAANGGLSWMVRDVLADIHVDVNSAVSLAHSDQGGYTALMYACASGEVECVKLLVEAGADARLRASNGNDATSLVPLAKKNEIVAPGILLPMSPTPPGGLPLRATPKKQFAGQLDSSGSAPKSPGLNPESGILDAQLVFSAVELHHLWERTQLFKGGRLVKVFDSFDVDGNRKLDATELRSLLSLLFGDVPVPTSTVERVARAIDKNGDGYIDIDELQTAWEAWFGQSTPPVDARRASGGECSIS